MSKYGYLEMFQRAPSFDFEIMRVDCKCKKKKPRQSFKTDIDIDFNNVRRTAHCFVKNDSTTVATF